MPQKKRKSSFGIGGIAMAGIIVGILGVAGATVGGLAATGKLFSKPAESSSTTTGMPTTTPQYPTGIPLTTPPTQYASAPPGIVLPGSGETTTPSNDCTCRTSWAYRLENNNPAAGYPPYYGCDLRAPDNEGQTWCYVTGTTQAACPEATPSRASNSDLAPESQELQDSIDGRLFYRDCP